MARKGITKKHLEEVLSKWRRELFETLSDYGKIEGAWSAKQKHNYTIAATKIELLGKILDLLQGKSAE